MVYIIDSTCGPGVGEYARHLENSLVGILFRTAHRDGTEKP